MILFHPSSCSLNIHWARQKRWNMTNLASTFPPFSLSRWRPCTWRCCTRCSTRWARSRATSGSTPRTCPDTRRPPSTLIPRTTPGCRPWRRRRRSVRDWSVLVVFDFLNKVDFIIVRVWYRGIWDGGACDECVNTSNRTQIDKILSCFGLIRWKTFITTHKCTKKISAILDDLIYFPKKIKP